MESREYTNDDLRRDVTEIKLHNRIQTMSLIISLIGLAIGTLILKNKT